MAKKKGAVATITYSGDGIYTYEAGKGMLRPGESATVALPLADHWKVLLDKGQASLS